MSKTPSSLTGDGGPQNKFELIEKASDSERTLKEAIKSSAPVQIWLKGQESAAQTHLAKVDKDKKRILTPTPPNFDLKKFEKDLTKLGAKRCYFSLLLSSAMILFSTDYQGIEGEGLAFAYPEKIYKVQRRQDLRFLAAGRTFSMEMEHPEDHARKIETKLFDLSASGLSFLVPYSDETPFKKGVTVRNISFGIRGKNILVDARVSYTQEYKPAPTSKHRIKVGVEFLGISTGDSSALAAFVFEETRKIFSKFV